MDDFKRELQGLSVSDFQAGPPVPLHFQGSPSEARLCFFTCFGFGCFGCGGCGCFGCGFFRCFGCGGFRCGFRCGRCGRCF
ncbi:heterocycloanthracin/sonorensin family bacteriocin [Paenibacillus elgii]|uniref:Heterocycloanthracin/sonorensin family bacteriocin n=1 Tax=Paenibacillus elgii TaxID=189691 RepID=A0A2T6G1F5_9BACL|nr:heterocycloanthracin/sonorensin family bacteriocin [Paenibacillus elgii]